MILKPNLLLTFSFLVLIFLLPGCNSGYEKIDNQWSYITYDEGAGKRIRNLQVDPKTFQVINNEYAKDDSNVFYKGRIINNADSKSFNVLKKGYSTDAQSVYLFHYQIINAVPDKFEIMDGLYSRDINNLYNGTLPLKIKSISNFKVIEANDKIQMISTKEFLKKFPSYSFIDSDKFKVVVYDNSVGKSGEIIYDGPIERK